jgi:hypothetical protein
MWVKNAALVKDSRRADNPWVNRDAKAQHSGGFPQGLQSGRARVAACWIEPLLDHGGADCPARRGRRERNEQRRHSVN